MLVLQVLLGLLTVGANGFYLACAIATWQFFQTQCRQIVAAPDHPTPPVTLMIPVCGLEPDAWENWTSFCQQDYPTYEVLFGVVDPADPAVPVLEKLAATFPQKVRVLTGLVPRGINHKDSSLSYLLEQARYDWLVFADSDIRVDAAYLHTVTAPLHDPQVGMVTCTFVGHAPQSLGAAIAALGRAIDFIPSLLLARILDGGLRCAVGATIATHKVALEKAGGLHLNRIGSDYNLGKRMAATGLKVVLSPLVLESDTGPEGLRPVYRRELRWARTIRFNRGPQYYTMMVCYGTLTSLVLLGLSGLAPWALALAGLTWLVRYGQAIAVLRILPAPQLMRWLWSLPLRDALSGWIWLRGAVGDRVVWRDRDLRIYRDGLITPIEASDHSP